MYRKGFDQVCFEKFGQVGAGERMVCLTRAAFPSRVIYIPPPCPSSKSQEHHTEDNAKWHSPSTPLQNREQSPAKPSSRISYNTTRNGNFDAKEGNIC